MRAANARSRRPRSLRACDASPKDQSYLARFQSNGFSQEQSDTRQKVPTREYLPRRCVASSLPCPWHNTKPNHLLTLLCAQLPK